jgi:hypothetical protein
MRQHNAENERVKREYLIYLKAAKGLSEASLDTVARAFHRFEVSTKPLAPQVPCRAGARRAPPRPESP